MTRRFEVLLHGDLVGYLSEQADGGSEMRFVEAYRRRGRRPVLGQKFEDDLERVYRNRKRQPLPDFFANLIPEGKLRRVIEEAGGLEKDDLLGLLEFVGRDLPGAVSVRLAAEGVAIEESAESREPSARDPVSTEEREQFRFSLAGVQLKFSMLLEGEKLTLPASDRSGEWIAKFDSPTYPELPENEYSMLVWARESGFDVPECKLLSVDDVIGFPRRYGLDGTHVLAVRRYDRTPEGPVHQEDFAQAIGFPPEKKYDQITHEAMALLTRRFVGPKAVEELLRRLVFVIASGNSDAHLKNWSLIYPTRIQAKLSPLYDQVSTVAWPAPAKELSLKLAGVKHFSRIDRDAMERFAVKAGLEAETGTEIVHETLEKLRQTWCDFGSDLPLPAEHKKALREHWKAVPLLREVGALD